MDFPRYLDVLGDDLHRVLQTLVDESCAQIGMSEQQIIHSSLELGCIECSRQVEDCLTLIGVTMC
ncbi:hypothetical protein D3C84_973140 [compost metagenome]